MARQEKKQTYKHEEQKIECRLRLKFVRDGMDLCWQIILDYCRFSDYNLGDDHVLSSFAINHYDLAVRVYNQFCKKQAELTDMQNEYFYETVMGEMEFKSRFATRFGTTYQVKWRQPEKKGLPSSITILKLNYFNTKEIDIAKHMANFDSDTVDDEKSARMATIKYVDAVKSHGDLWGLYPDFEDSWADQAKKRATTTTFDSNEEGELSLPLWARMRSMRNLMG
jgi:hypothetical protein